MANEDVSMDILREPTTDAMQRTIQKNNDDPMSDVLQRIEAPSLSNDEFLHSTNKRESSKKDGLSDKEIFSVVCDIIEYGTIHHGINALRVGFAKFPTCIYIWLSMQTSTLCVYVAFTLSCVTPIVASSIEFMTVVRSVNVGSVNLFRRTHVLNSYESGMAKIKLAEKFSDIDSSDVDDTRKKERRKTTSICVSNESDNDSQHALHPPPKKPISETSINSNNNNVPMEDSPLGDAAKQIHSNDSTSGQNVS
ncbi:uncharacterized protein LOC113004094 [Solenopsis invicta]|uniref:uncharacterized protein LOC113004094 n=1 Tax=Solenopsis invicta TaxID=13686 RepID=UPI00193CEDA5|nr:uncharacterized protein LOC113004094 [Solenopsis invicta]